MRLPTSDHVEPAAEVLDAAVAFIRKHERAGGRVYVHCKALCGNQPVRRVHDGVEDDAMIQHERAVKF